jgi:hypothetical protein
MEETHNSIEYHVGFAGHTDQVDIEASGTSSIEAFFLV